MKSILVTIDSQWIFTPEANGMLSSELTTEIRKNIEDLQKAFDLKIGSCHCHNLDSKDSLLPKADYEKAIFLRKNNSIKEKHQEFVRKRAFKNGISQFSEGNWRLMQEVFQDPHYLLANKTYEGASEGFYDSNLNQVSSIKKYSKEKFINDVKKGKQVYFQKANFSILSNPLSSEYISELARSIEGTRNTIFNIIGLTSENCVINSAKDLRKLGLQVKIVSDAIAPLNIEGTSKMEKIAKENNIPLVKTKEII